MSASGPPKGRPSSPCEQAAAQTYGEGERTWGRSAPGSRSRSTGLSVGRTTTLRVPMGHGGERLLAWYGAGDTEYRLPGTDMVFMVSAQTAEFLRETRETTGALVFGRRTFDLTHGGVATPLGCAGLCGQQLGPTSVGLRRIAVHLRHRRTGKRLEQAQAVAGDKDVGEGAASIVQQCIRAGLLDEIHIDLVPVLLGAVSACSTTSAPGRSTWSARG